MDASKLIDYIRELEHELMIARDVLEDIVVSDFGALNESQQGSVYMSIGGINRVIPRKPLVPVE